MPDPDLVQDEEPQVDPEEVKALYAREQWKGDDVEVLAEAELSADEQKHIFGDRKVTHHEANHPERKGQPTAEAGAEEASIPMNPVFNRDTANLESQLQWQTLMGQGYEPINVTETERVVYFKAMISDMPVEFEIELDYGQPLFVRIKNCSNYENNVVKAAMDLDEKEGRYNFANMEGQAVLMTRVQYFMAAIRLIGFNNTPVEAFQVNTSVSIVENAKLLHQFVEERIIPLSGAKWGSILTALLVYEAKLRACSDAALKKNFSPTAAAASS